MSAYITVDEFKQQAYQTVANADDAKFGVLVDNSSRFVDRLVAVGDDYFAAAGVIATPRTFYGNGTGYLSLGPYVTGSLTTVAMPAGYTVPYYAERDGHLVVTDINGVVLLDLYRQRFAVISYHWQAGVPITVTAKWGFAATPADIKQVTIEIAIALWRGVDKAWAKAAALDVVENTKLDLSPLAQNILDRYRVKGAVAFV